MRYSWFHENCSFSVQCTLINKHYLSIPEWTQVAGGTVIRKHTIQGSFDLVNAVVLTVDVYVDVVVLIVNVYVDVADDAVVVDVDRKYSRLT